MTVNFEAAAHGADLVATADITRRGKGLCFVAVSVEAPEGRAVAHALVTYRLG
jgi:acyl-coenzyme A thioesterase PaaI-like protein